MCPTAATTASKSLGPGLYHVYFGKDIKLREVGTVFIDFNGVTYTHHESSASSAIGVSSSMSLMSLEPGITQDDVEWPLRFLVSFVWQQQVDSWSYGGCDGGWWQWQGFTHGSQ